MGYANVYELKRCLEDCVEFCSEHPNQIGDLYKSKLEETLGDLERSIELTDRRYGKWAQEEADDKRAKKRLAKLYREAARRLEEIGAIGYPSQNLSYWDRENLFEAIREMEAYLRERSDKIEFADEYAEKFERNMEIARGEREEASHAFDDFEQFVQFRRRALNDANQVIADFRSALRDALGEDHELYESIRWAMSVSPDQTVL